MELLTFRAADSVLGVPLDDVQEIVDSWSITRLPLLPDGLPGVTNLRGTPIPVAKLELFVGGSSACASRTMIVLRSSIALLVDRVETLVDAGAIESSEDDPPWSLGIAGEIRIIDGRRLLEKSR